MPARASARRSHPLLLPIVKLLRSRDPTLLPLEAVVALYSGSSNNHKGSQERTVHLSPSSAEEAEVLVSNVGCPAIGQGIVLLRAAAVRDWAVVGHWWMTLWPRSCALAGIRDLSGSDFQHCEESWEEVLQVPMKEEDGGCNFFEWCDNPSSGLPTSGRASTEGKGSYGVAK